MRMVWEALTLWICVCVRCRSALFSYVVYYLQPPSRMYNFLDCYKFCWFICSENDEETKITEARDTVLHFRLFKGPSFSIA